MINLELPWNPAVLEQRIGRIYRLGQTKPIDVYNLVAEQGIESRIAGLVGSKQAFFKGLFDGDSDSVQFEQSGSFLARVEKIYDAATLAATRRCERRPRKARRPIPRTLPSTTRLPTRSSRCSRPPMNPATGRPTAVRGPGRQRRAPIAKSSPTATR